MDFVRYSVVLAVLLSPTMVGAATRPGANKMPADKYAGMVVRAFIYPAESAAEQPVTLVISTRNVNPTAIHYHFERWDIPFTVWVESQAGKRVPMTENGRKVWWVGGRGGSFPPPIFVSVPPGCGFTTKVPLTRYFDVAKPGRYTVFVAFPPDLCRTKPVNFTVTKRGRDGHAAHTGDRGAASRQLSFAQLGRSFRRPVAASDGSQRRGGGGLVLEATPWSRDPNAVVLVVSLTNSGGRVAPVSRWTFSNIRKYLPEGRCRYRRRRAPSAPKS